ncbi:MAG: DUF2147 domain-containing protein [Candidatus Binatia bacterium]
MTKATQASCNHRSDNTWKPALAVLFIMVLCGPARPLFAATPIGLWYAEGGAAQVEIRQCGDALCGRVVWLRSPLAENGCTLQDHHNPDASLRNRPVLGLEVLQGLTPDERDERAWSGGTIYDPSNGKTYSCRFTMDGNHRLQLRGYVGIPLIGRTTTWIRVGTETQQCRQ